MLFTQNVNSTCRILGGATDSFVFVLHGEEYIVRENIYVQHLTDVSFEAKMRIFI